MAAAQRNIVRWSGFVNGMDEARKGGFALVPAGSLGSLLATRLTRVQPLP